MPYWKYTEWKPASVPLPPGGNGENPGGLPRNSKKVKKRGCKQRLAIERGNPLFTELLARTSDEWLSRIHSILLQIDLLQLTAALLYPTVSVKDNTSKDQFSRLRNMQEFGIHIEWTMTQDTIGLQHPEGKNFALGVCVCVVKCS